MFLRNIYPQVVVTHKTTNNKNTYGPPVPRGLNGLGGNYGSIPQGL